MNLVIKVIDTGHGMTREDQQKLFRPLFTSTDPDSALKNPNSHGIGLNLSKQIAEALGGSLTCNSEKGMGTTFTLNLPVTYAEKRIPIRSEQKPTTVSLSYLTFVEKKKEV